MVDLPRHALPVGEKDRHSERPLPRLAEIPLYDLSDEKTIIGYAEPHEAVDGNDPANTKAQKRAESRFNARAPEFGQGIATPADLIADTLAAEAMLPDSAPDRPPPRKLPDNSGYSRIFPAQFNKALVFVTEQIH